MIGRAFARPRPLTFDEPFADHPLRAELGQPAVRDAERTEHLIVVLSESRRRRSVVPGRTRGDPKRPARKAHPTGQPVLEVGVETPRGELVDVVHPVGSHQTFRGNAATPEHVRNVIGGKPCRPGGQRLVEGVVIFQARFR